MHFPRLLSTTLLVISYVLPALPTQQPATTAVTIRVLDPIGGPVSHAKIRITPAPANPPAKMETNDAGEFTMPLPPGTYDLAVEQSGFKIGKSPLAVMDAVPALTVPIVLQIAETGSPQVQEDTPEKDKLHLLAVPYREPLVLSRPEFAALPHITVTVKNGHSNEKETYSGVRLSDLFAKMGAPIGKDLHGKAMSLYVYASAADGYAVVFSIAEIDPNFHPGEIIVADQMNGHALDANSGPFKLVASEDKRPARWVRNLTTLELKSSD